MLHWGIRYIWAALSWHSSETILSLCSASHTQQVLDISVGVCPLNGQGTVILWTRPVCTLKTNAHSFYIYLILCSKANHAESASSRGQIGTPLLANKHHNRPIDHKISSYREFCSTWIWAEMGEQKTLTDRKFKCSSFVKRKHFWLTFLKKPMKWKAK